MAMKTIHLSISGRVQGVFYRASMCEAAKLHQIVGWVRNRRNGSVEAMLQGEESNIERMINWARRGPAAAKVERIDISEGHGEYQDFTARDTL